MCTRHAHQIQLPLDSQQRHTVTVGQMVLILKIIAIFCILAISNVPRADCRGGRGGGRGGRGSGGRGGKSSKGGRRGSLTGSIFPFNAITGSQLERDLGYKIGRMRANSNDHGYNPCKRKHTSYSLHHYYHENDHMRDRKINPQMVTSCGDINFCPPNTETICLTEGTVYCAVPKSEISNCPILFTSFPCVETVLTETCESTNSEAECRFTVPSQIPCYTNIFLLNSKSEEEFCVIVVATPLFDGDCATLLIDVLSVLFFVAMLVSIWIWRKWKRNKRYLQDI